MPKVNAGQAYAKCVDCSTRRLVKTREWDRAAQPRCYACGGRLEPLSDRSKSGSVVLDMREAARERMSLELQRKENQDGI